MRRTAPSLGVFQVIREELNKAFAVLKYDAKGYTDLVKGQDGLTPEEIERQAKMKEAYKQARSPPRESEAQGSAAPHPAAQSAEEEATKTTTWAQRFAKVRDEMAATFGPKAGVAAIIDHCTKSHAAAVAVDLDIDVKSVEVRTEKSAVGEGSKVVGYIDAPAATEEEVLIFAEKLTKACPAARTYGDVEWRRSPGPRV